VKKTVKKLFHQTLAHILKDVLLVSAEKVIS